jgi:hypothetical protein
MSKKRGGSIAGPSDIDSLTILELTRAIEGLVTRGEKPGEALMGCARQLARQWKIKKRPLLEGIETNLIQLLGAFVVLLRRDHELVERIRGCFPNDFDNLSDASELDELREFAAFLLSAGIKLAPKAKQKYESKRRSKWLGIGEIKSQFASAKTAQILCALGPSHSAYCLDDIFAGRGVSMRRLQELFGMDRHRFPKKLVPIKDGRETRYDYRAVAKIMDALLSERLKKRKMRTGRSPRVPWLHDRDVRTRVLNGIKERIESVSTLQHIKTKFLLVIRRHLTDSGKQ